MRNPKVVLEKLTGGQFERERKCWEETSLEILRKRGENTGLIPFLKKNAISDWVGKCGKCGRCGEK